MSLTFSTSLSGLRANSDSLSTTGNNIANSNTTAYKSDSLNFGDIFHDSVSARFNGAGQSIQIGNGVRSVGNTINYTQGSLDSSASPTNVGIQGNGFFLVASAEGVPSYTRAGDFLLDRNGFLVAPGGQRVQGYQAVNGVIDPDSPLTSIQVPSGQFAEPVETTQATVRTNLSAGMAVGDVFHTPVQVYDSKGVAHTLDLAYTKQNNTDYLVTATLDGVGVQLDSGAGAADNATLTFDANGRLVIPAPPAAPPTLAVLPENVIAPGVSTLNGASLDSININLLRTNPDGTMEGNITNFDAASSVTSTLQNGFASGTLSGVSFSPDSSGTLLAVFNNGQTRALGQVAIATFNSQEGLRRLGDNLFGETISSGPPSVGIAGTGGRGGIIGGVLENSNVDISTEFTELIIAQRGFQANSRVINTINQTLQELLQII